FARDPGWVPRWHAGAPPAMALGQRRVIAGWPRQCPTAHMATLNAAIAATSGPTSPPSELNPSTPSEPQCEATGSGSSPRQPRTLVTIPVVRAPGTTRVHTAVERRWGTRGWVRACSAGVVPSGAPGRWAGEPVIEEPPGLVGRP